MRTFVRGRLFLGVAILVAAPLATMAFNGSASASTLVVCHKLVGTAANSTATVSGCPAGSTGGTGAISNFAPTGGNVTWANGTTTNFTASYTVLPTGCPSGSALFVITGSVSSSTNSATPVGQTVKMKICDNETSGVLKNKKGTTVKF